MMAVRWVDVILVYDGNEDWRLCFGKVTWTIGVYIIKVIISTLSSCKESNDMRLHEVTLYANFTEWVLDLKLSSHPCFEDMCFTGIC